MQQNPFGQCLCQRYVKCLALGCFGFKMKVINCKVVHKAPYKGVKLLGHYLTEWWEVVQLRLFYKFRAALPHLFLCFDVSLARLALVN